MIVIFAQVVRNFILRVISPFQGHVVLGGFLLVGVNPYPRVISPRWGQQYACKHNARGAIPVAENAPFMTIGNRESVNTMLTICIVAPNGG